VNRAPNNIMSLANSVFLSLPNTLSIFGLRGPLTEWGIHAIAKKYVYQARLEAVTAHTRRHSFAKNLVNSRTPLDQVATLLGHESLDTTRIYTQPSARDLERAIRNAAGEIVDEHELR
jgi:site-specific recombinase XerD